jgi:hypothetical protein
LRFELFTVGSLTLAAAAFGFLPFALFSLLPLWRLSFASLAAPLPLPFAAPAFPGLAAFGAAFGSAIVATSMAETSAFT